MSIKPSELADIVINDTRENHGLPGLRLLLLFLQSSSGRNEVIRLERKYTGKAQPYQQDSRLNFYPNEYGGEHYVAFEPLEEALLAQIAFALVNSAVETELPTAVLIQSKVASDLS